METSMRYLHINHKRLLVFSALTLLAIWLLHGCASQEKEPAPTTAPAVSGQYGAVQTKGRAQLWSENCMRCHNMRPPDWYSDAQWEVAMEHMHIRGYLTGQESKAIEEFLKASN